MMNDLEFREQYKRLKEVHPSFFAPQEKMNTVWDYVKDMESKWFESLVDRIVLASDPRNPKFDIGDAVAAERRNRKSKEFADDVCRAMESWKAVSEQGLGKVLEKYNSGSLLEAVLKSKKGEI